MISLLAFSVYKVFENVAQKYDTMNDVMSLGIHRLWKDMLLHAMHPQPGARLLDVAGGTGKAVCVHLCKASHLNPPLVVSHFCFVGDDPPLQVTFPSVSWSTFVLSKNGRSGGRCDPCRRHHRRTFPTTTSQRTRTRPRNPGLWSVTSTRRC